MNLVYNFLFALYEFLTMLFLIVLSTLATLNNSLHPILKRLFTIPPVYTFKSMFLTPCNIVKNINEALNVDLKGFSIVSTLATIKK